LASKTSFGFQRTKIGKPIDKISKTLICRINLKLALCPFPTASTKDTDAAAIEKKDTMIIMTFLSVNSINVPQLTKQNNKNISARRLWRLCIGSALDSSSATEAHPEFKAAETLSS
jgi:hypothetical protein